MDKSCDKEVKMREGKCCIWEASKDMEEQRIQYEELKTKIVYMMP